MAAWLPLEVLEASSEKRGGELNCTRCGQTNPDGARYCARCGVLMLDGDLADLPPTVAFGGPTNTLHPVAPGPQSSSTSAIAALDTRHALLLSDDGPTRGGSYLLDTDFILVGRERTSDVYLDDVSVSRRHAEIRLTLEDFWLIDLGSTNGTYVNRQRVERARLRDGDELHIGRFRFLFRTRSGSGSSGSTTSPAAQQTD